MSSISKKIIIAILLCFLLAACWDYVVRIDITESDYTRIPCNESNFRYQVSSLEKDAVPSEKVGYETTGLYPNYQMLNGFHEEILWVQFYIYCDPQKEPISVTEKFTLNEITKGDKNALKGNDYSGRFYYIKELGAASEKWFTNIADALRNHSIVSRLTLRGQGLSEIPQEIFQLKNLVYLDVSKNKITRVPSGIGNFQNLKYLDLSKNDIEYVSPDIGKLRNLRYLDFSENRLTSLPPNIGEMENLRKLSLNENRLDSIPSEIGRLSKLEELQVWRNELQGIPAEILGSRSLQVLVLSHNHIKELPVEIGSLRELKWLHLDRNEIAGVPSEVGLLKKLRYLDMGYNHLASLPAEIGNIESLEWLYLDHNYLQILPPGMERLKNLRQLILHKNELSKEEKSRIKKLMPNVFVHFKNFLYMYRN